MAIEFDPPKETINQGKHKGLSLTRAMDVELLAIVPDDRKDYGEVRLRGFGRLDGEFVCLVFTYRGANIRPISLRRARVKEMKRYVPASELGTG